MKESFPSTLLQKTKEEKRLIIFIAGTEQQEKRNASGKQG